MSVHVVKVRRAVALLTFAALSACGGDDDTDPTAVTTTTDGSTATTDGDTTTTTDGPTTTTDGDTTTTDGDTTETTTLPQVTTTVIGTAVGGSSGGIGSENTNPFSEAVRNEDGTCSGWDGPQDVQWTAGLESGAPVRFLDDDGNEIGTGQIGTSSFEDVDPNGIDQWNCLFPFEGEVFGQPTSLRIQVADLPPWRARSDPADPSRWVVSVDTMVRVDVVDQCVDPPTNDTVRTPFAVGQFWFDGLATVCDAGFTIAQVERPCRPPNAASERVLSVVLADDPTIVVEDAGGPGIDPAELEVGTPVVVRVATGRPCG